MPAACPRLPGLVAALVVVVVMVAGAGCNPLLGLGAAGADEDGDLVPADLDNCPQVDNPGQEDGDGDGLGDACDACAGCGDGSFVADARDCGDHDEDGDGTLDGCDPCPIAGGPADLDADGDGVGDGCDVNPGAPDRVLFDPFTQLRGIGWSGGWPLGPDGDSLGAIPGNTTMTLGPDLMLAGAWRLELAAVSLPLDEAETLAIGVLQSGLQPLPRPAGRCFVTRVGASYEVAVELGRDVGLVSTTVATLDQPQRLRLSMPASRDRLLCEFVAGGVRSSVETPVSYDDDPFLVQVQVGPGRYVSSFLLSERAP